MDQLRRVDEYIEANADEAVELLRRLMRIDSTNPPGNERDIADACAREARELGFEVEQVVTGPDRVNNICRLRGSAGNPTLLFNSHLDTPPVSDPSAWRYPPFAAEIHDAAVWGVGARSAKAGLAATLFAARAVRAAGVVLKGNVVHVQTADELGGGGFGWEKLVEREELRDGLRADFGVFTEANPPLQLEIAARGLVLLGFAVHGFARHTKYKVEKVDGPPVVNAVAKAGRVIEAVERMDFSGWQPHRYIPGPPVISVNRVEGGHSNTQMADRCVLWADCRYLPGQTSDGVVADVVGLLAELAAQDADLRVDVTVLRTAEPLEIDPEEKIVQALQRAIAGTIGHEIPLGGVGSTSDMRWMVNALGIPSCKFVFPSSPTGTDEHESITDYLNTVRVYSRLMLDLLT